MLLFYNMHKFQDSYLYINTLLQVFFLTSVSTQLNILLVIYSDFLHLKTNRNIKPTSICIITGKQCTKGRYLSNCQVNLLKHYFHICTELVIVAINKNGAINIKINFNVCKRLVLLFDGNFHLSVKTE